MELSELDSGMGKPAWVSVRYGLPRYRVFELIKEGHFRSALIKRKGRKKGLRLIELRSVTQYLEEPYLKAGGTEQWLNSFRAGCGSFSC
jgi:hypothetical protein